jgi:hypothetical protein
MPITSNEDEITLAVEDPLPLALNNRYEDEINFFEEDRDNLSTTINESPEEAGNTSSTKFWGFQTPHISSRNLDRGKRIFGAISTMSFGTILGLLSKNAFFNNATNPTNNFFLSPLDPGNPDQNPEFVASRTLVPIFLTSTFLFSGFYIAKGKEKEEQQITENPDLPDSTKSEILKFSPNEFKEYFITSCQNYSPDERNLVLKAFLDPKSEAERLQIIKSILLEMNNEKFNENFANLLKLNYLSEDQASNIAKEFSEKISQNSSEREVVGGSPTAPRLTAERAERINIEIAL